MVPPADNSADLSVTRAFVVQFRADTAVAQGHLSGRVEHISRDRPPTFSHWRRCWHSWHRCSALSVCVAPNRNGYAWRKTVNPIKQHAR
jgi:hypothetical protein